MLTFQTRDGEKTITGKTYKECRSKACRLLSVSGPRALHFEELDGTREFYKSIYEGQDWYTDAAGRKHS